MPKINIIHTAQIPDCTFGIFITMNDGNCDINCGDFISPGMENTQDHDALKVLGGSIMDVLDVCIENALKEMGQIPDEDNIIEKEEGNVVYLKTAKLTNSEKVDA